MSWLKFNEGLNTIKGQLSNLASGVLAEGIVGGSDGGDRSGQFQTEDDHNLTRNENNWSWEPSNGSTEKRDVLVQDLRRKVDLLESEKRDLIVSLDQLDLDNQQTTAELVRLKDMLQTSYDELGADYERLKKEYGEVLTENMEKGKQIELLHHGELVQRIETLEGECENYKRLWENERLNDGEWQSLRSELEDVKGERDALWQKCQTITKEESAKDARILESVQAEKRFLQGMLSDLKRDFVAVVEEFQNVSKVQRALDELKNRPRVETTACQDSERQVLHEKYLGIITDCMEKYTKTNATSTISSIMSSEEPEIVEFANEVENLLKLLIDFKSKTEALEREVCEITREKNTAINEKNFEIEKLLQNSKILSQEVIAKTQVIKDYKTECNELVKNNDLLILELENIKNSRLQTISETNEENMLLMESQLDNANKKIEDMELIITDLENSKQETNEEVQNELDYIKRQLNITGHELSDSKADHQQLLAHCQALEEEKQTFKQALDKAKADYENIEYKSNEAFVALESLREENEELRRNSQEAKVSALEDRLASLEAINNEQAAEIKTYTERLQRSKITETGAKLQIDTLGRELQNAQESKRLLEEKLESLERTLLEERSRYEDELSATRRQMTDLQNGAKLLEAQLAQLSEARTELAQLLTQKHEENVRYHAEIERLNSLKAKAETIEQKDEEIEKLNDQNQFLREKCEVIAQNLLREQSSVQKILAEKSSVSEREQALERELQRLRLHLVEVEETYTRELVHAEEKNREMQAKVNEIETREKNSNYVYTSANIRANQQVETLQTQLQLVSNQRDELRIKLSDVEDENNKHAAALTNLQLVLEHFQKDKDKDVHQETERIRRQISLEQRVQEALREENSNLRSQLEESKQGLQAASRLTDQLEKSKKQIIALREEVSKLQENLQTNESSCRELHAQVDTKIDKSLIKNLIIGYVSSNPNDQRQILKIIATVLDFNKKESEKVSLNKQQSGWLQSILNPQGLDASHDQSRQSLSAAFVQFLEDESKPKVLPNLLISSNHQSNDGGTSSTTPRQSPMILNEVVLPTFVDFGKSRNSSSILKDALKDNT